MTFWTINSHRVSRPISSSIVGSTTSTLEATSPVLSICARPPPWRISCSETPFRNLNRASAETQPLRPLSFSTASSVPNVRLPCEHCSHFRWFFSSHLNVLQCEASPIQRPCHERTCVSQDPLSRGLRPRRRILPILLAILTTMPTPRVHPHGRSRVRRCLQSRDGHLPQT